MFTINILHDTKINETINILQPHAPVALGILPAEMASVLMLLPGVIKHLTVLTDPMRKDAVSWLINGHLSSPLTCKV